MIKLVMSDNATAMNLDVIVNKEADGQYVATFPESGLHPSKQMDVMEEFYKAYKNGVLGETCFIATHSELIILRAMRMIREGRASLNDIQLWQSRIVLGEPKLIEIELSGDGELLDNVKDGFFDIL